MSNLNIAAIIICITARTTQHRITRGTQSRQFGGLCNAPYRHIRGRHGFLLRALATVRSLARVVVILSRSIRLGLCAAAAPWASVALAIPAGDLAPRGAPDGQLDAGDLLVLQRIILGAETATSYDKLVGDVAPIGNPDGMLNAGDLPAYPRLCRSTLRLYSSREQVPSTYKPWTSRGISRLK